MDFLHLDILVRNDPDLCPGRIDCRRNAVLGHPFFLSPVYQKIDREKSFLSYLGKVYFGLRPPLAASLQVASEYGVKSYICRQTKSGIRFWTDPIDSLFREALDELVASKSPAFVVSSEADRDTCTALMWHRDLRRRIDREKMIQGFSGTEQAAIAKYREEVYGSVPAKNKRKK